tara:strand:- start:310 stop:546 length:237 start_codon:yes stop_codon:yes gene_type:complete
MKFRVYVSFKEGVLDPEAEAIKKTLDTLGFKEIKKLSKGKFFNIEIKDNSKNKEDIVEKISDEILSNPIIENFKIEKL